MKKIVIILSAILFGCASVGEQNIQDTDDANQTIVEVEKSSIPAEYETENIGDKSAHTLDAEIPVPDTAVDSLNAVIAGLKAEIEAHKKQLSEQESTIAKRVKESRMYLYAAFGLFTVAVVLLILLILVQSKTKRKFRRREREYSKLEMALSERKSEEDDVKQKIGLLNFEKKIWEREKRELQELVVSLRGKKDGEAAPIVSASTAFEASEPPNPALSLLYADSIYNDTFNRVTTKPNDDTIFELTKGPDDRTATFTIWENVYSKILRRPEFVDGCDTQKIGNMSLEVERGTAKLEDGKWKIIQKAKVKLI